jgi:hypothetical protein
MRRSLIIALSCLSLLGLAACGDKKSPTSQGDKMNPNAGSMEKMNDGMGSMKQ